MGAPGNLGVDETFLGGGGSLNLHLPKLIGLRTKKGEFYFM